VITINLEKKDNMSELNILKNDLSGDIGDEGTYIVVKT
jgi:hypothetical protein